MSFDLGYMLHERDKKRATLLFRTQSLGKNSVDLEEETSPVLGNFEPDWSKFEHVYARGNEQSAIYAYFFSHYKIRSFKM